MPTRQQIPTALTTRHHAQSGLTLVELLIVLAIIALAAGLTAPSFASARERLAAKAFALEMKDALRAMRSEAILTAAPLRFAVDEDGRYRAGAAPWTLPVRRVTLTIAPALDGAAGRALTFFPDGSTTGGIILITAGAHRWQVKASLNGDVQALQAKAD